MAREGEAAGVIALADVPKDTAAETVATLKGMGLKVGLITGDNEGTARAMGRALGIDRVLA